MFADEMKKERKEKRREKRAPFFLSSCSPRNSKGEKRSIGSPTDLRINQVDGHSPINQCPPEISFPNGKRSESTFRLVVVVVGRRGDVEVPVLSEMSFDHLHALVNRRANEPVQIEGEEQRHGQQQRDEQQKSIRTIFVH